ncbi:MAG: D-2-hydroxyacid dehydrogenase [Anaerolineales bacterium]|jgi:phosphoglycerate dehydrogenase-like enzyme|nr:D-2-hydroxyacid dehydrogenase [Anaerolineales bacterium]
MTQQPPSTKPIEVLITVPFNETLLNRLSLVSERLKFTTIRARDALEIPEETWATAEILYTSRALPTPEQAPRLRWIQFHWAGIDHAIDALILKQPNLLITHQSGASASQMAEFALMMLLALGHHFPALQNHQRRGEWPSDRWERLNPRELRGSTVGIVGYGSIGRQIARLLQTLGATVLATKRDVMRPNDTGYIPEGLGDPKTELVNRLYPPQAIRSMFKECDFVVVTVPLTAETRGLIGAEELAALKPGAYLVDISRGGVIQQEALINALKDNKIAAAALDVFAKEPLPMDNPLWKLPNVIITPHIAGFSPHYDERAVILFEENLRRYLSGLPLYNQLNLEIGY